MSFSCKSMISFYSTVFFLIYGPIDFLVHQTLFVLSALSPLWQVSEKKEMENS